MSWALYLAFDALGEPKGQPRPRACKRGAHAGVYDPGTAEGWKQAVAFAAGQALHGVSPMLEGPIRLGLELYFPRPKRLMRKKDPEGPILHTAMPDFDNAEKAVMDCLTQIGVWRDDSQVASHIGDKFYAAKGQAPGALIQVFTWKED